MPDELPAYVPWIIYLVPALAGLIQHFFGASCRARATGIVVLGMGGALVLSFKTLFAWAGLDRTASTSHSTWNWLTLAAASSTSASSSTA